MPIKVKCSGCGVSLSTPDASAGKRAKCPQCGHAIQVPKLPVEEVILDAENSIFDDISDDELTSGAATHDDRKPCPACGERIFFDAIKCRYCGEIFDQTLKKQDRKKRKKQSTAAEGGDMTTGDWFIAILCSGIGCIAGIVWMIQGKPKGKKMFLVSLGVQLFWGVVRFLIEAASEVGP